MYDFLRARFGIVLGGVNYLSVGMFGCIWMDGMGWLQVACLRGYIYIHWLLIVLFLSMVRSVFGLRSLGYLGGGFTIWKAI